MSYFDGLLEALRRYKEQPHATWLHHSRSAPFRPSGRPCPQQGLQMVQLVEMAGLLPSVVHLVSDSKGSQEQLALIRLYINVD